MHASSSHRLLTALDSGPEFEQLVCLFEQVAAQLSKAEIQNRLWVIESRLGTDGEGPCDFAEARALAHQLNNLRTVEAFTACI